MSLKSYLNFVLFRNVKTTVIHYNLSLSHTFALDIKVKPNFANIKSF